MKRPVKWLPLLVGTLLSYLGAVGADADNLPPPQLPESPHEIVVYGGDGDVDRLKDRVQKKPRATHALVGWTGFGDSDLAALVSPALPLKSVEVRGATRYTAEGSIGVRIGAAGWRHLAALPNLRCLKVYDVPINEEAAAEIAKLASLTELDLASCRLDERAVLQLAKLTKLRKLSLHQNDLSPSAVTKLVGGLKELEVLSLGYIAVTDDDMRAVANLPRLNEFTFYNSKVTDDGILTLAGSKSLTSMTVWPGTIRKHDTVKRVEEMKSSSFLHIVHSLPLFGK